MYDFLSIVTADRKEKEKIKEIPEYINLVKHYYYVNGDIEEACYNGYVECGKHIKKDAKKIHKYVISSARKINIEDMFIKIKNKHLKIFLVVCILTVEYGDSKNSFVKNLNIISQELELEKIYETEKRDLFYGLFFIPVVPLFFIDAFKKFVITNWKDIEYLYEGYVSIIFERSVVILSIAIYIIIKNFIKYKKEENIYFENIFKDKFKKVFDIIEHKKIKKEKVILLISYLAVNIFFALSNMPINKMIAPKTQVVIIAISLGITMLNAAMKTLSFKMIAEYKKQEVLIFTSLIIILKNFNSIGVKELLFWMEKFSFKYKMLLKATYVNYEHSSVKALNKLKSKIKDVEFKSIIKRLIKAEESHGVRKMFDSLDVEKEILLKRQEVLNRIIMKKQANTAKMLAYIPIYYMLAVIVVYPVMKFGISEINKILGSGSY